VSSVNAQSVDRFKITVPFPFVLNSQTLPAGTYAIERTDFTKPNILTLKKVNGGIVRVIVTQRVEKEDPSAEPSLIFIRREGKHYLFQVWNVGAMNGGQIPYMSEQNRQRTGFTLVTLRSKVR
jgi:hypothetical protein